MMLVNPWRRLADLRAGRALTPPLAAELDAKHATSFQALLTDWSKAAIDAALSGPPSGQIEIEPQAAAAILRAFDTARPVRAISETQPLMDRLGGVGASFCDLDPVERLVVSSVQYRSARALPLIARFRKPPHGWRGRGWRGRSPIGTDVLALYFARMTFGSPDLQHHFMYALYQGLRRSVLLRPGDAPYKIRASKPLLWSLVALRLRPPKAGWSRRVERRAYMLIQRIAEKEIETPGWADFHAQWVVLNTLARTANSDETPLRQTLATFPLVANIRAVMDCGDDAERLSQLFAEPEVAAGEDAAADASLNDRDAAARALLPQDWWASAPRYAVPLLARGAKTLGLEASTRHV
jgi:hypothetical protein